LSTATGFEDGFGTMFNLAHKARARKSILKYNKLTKPPFQRHFYDGDAATPASITVYNNRMSCTSLLTVTRIVMTF